MNISNQDQFEFLKFGKLPDPPIELHGVWKIAAKAQKFGIEWSGRKLADVLREIKNHETTNIHSFRS